MHFIAPLRKSVFDLVVTHLAAHTEKGIDKVHIKNEKNSCFQFVS